MRERESLSHEELVRYDRHLRIPEVGLEGQLALRSSSALLVGCGGLGAPAALYLAAAGVGHIKLVDFDRIESSNLQRQVLFQADQVGKSKAECSAERLRSLNPGVEISVFDGRLSRENALDLVSGCDVVLDGSDNFETRYIVNDACCLLDRPNVYASVFRFQGQLAVFDTASGSACYRCLFPELPPPELTPSCAEGGVLGVLPGVVGSLQAAEALKVLLGAGRPLKGRLLILDLLRTRFRELDIPRDPLCPLCKEGNRAVQLNDPRLRDRPSFRTSCQVELTSSQVRERLERGEGWVAVDVREVSEWEAGRLGELQPVHIPLDELLEDRFRLPEDRPLLLYCRSGQRSLKAALHLRSRGYTQSWSLAGGFPAWSAP